MNFSHLSPNELCRHLAEGWTAEHPDVARELFNRLRRRWHANPDTEKAGVSTFHGEMELNKVRLLGASEFGCLVLSRGAAVERAMVEFWQ
jgi:hypothetical protein